MAEATVPDGVRQGVYITLAYVLLFKIFIIGQAITKFQLKALYASKGQKMDRYYNTKDKKMLAWDRVVGNMLEQSMPFLVLFWLNVGVLTLKGEEAHGHVITAAWFYIVARALYPVAWFSGGGGPGGPRIKILFSTVPMY
ncbi:unnamed protein product, partial [Discosporangium mesarthrocarpum]